MATELIEVDVNNTKLLLGSILTQVNNDNRVQFLCPAGSGEAIMQRARVMLSRVRKRLEQRGKARKHFKLHHSIHPYTDREGIRHDCVTVWRSKNLRHSMAETLEDLVGHSQQL